MLNNNDRIKQIEQKIGYVFKNKKLLLNALMHRSYVNENIQLNLKDNEKLEFLGDAVINLIATEYISEEFKKLSEGDLSKIKSQIVSEAVFSSISEDLKLGKYLFLSNGENLSGGRFRHSILGDLFEALIGAIFLDSDYYNTRKIAIKFLKEKLEHLDEIDGIGDYKTQLQEKVQSEYKSMPIYNLVNTDGPDHDKIFEVSVSINDEIIAYGVEKSKKRAEKKAAKLAMKKLGYL